LDGIGFSVLAKSLTRDVLVHSASGATSGQLSVDHHRRQAAKAVLSSASGDLMLMHVMDLDPCVAITGSGFSDLKNSRTWNSASFCEEPD
jgi:hypothetical protein